MICKNGYALNFSTYIGIDRKEERICFFYPPMARILL
jgi:hypothetical protein